MQTPSWKRWNLVAALVAGALLRVVFLLNHPRFGGDTLVYGDLAQNMLLHHVFGFTEEVVRPTLIRLPGYPAFLAACFVLFGRANYVAVIWLQAAIDLTGCVLLAGLARRLAGERAESAALWLGVLCPFTANYTAAALTETLSIYAVIVSIYAFERMVTTRFRGVKRDLWSVLVGLALAVAVMVRPDQGLVAAAILPAMFWWGWRSAGGHRKGRRAMLGGLLPVAIATGVLVLPLALWGARNWRVFHVVQPLAPRYANDPGEANPYGFQRWYRTWAIDYVSTLDVYWNYDGSTIAMKDLPPRAFDSPQQRVETAALIDRYNEETTATPELDAGFAATAAERVRQAPLRYYLVMPVARLLNMWLRPRTELLRLPIAWWEFSAHLWQSLLEAAFGVVNLGYLVLAGVGLWRWRKSGWSGYSAIGAAMVAFVLLRSALLLTIDNSEPRYTLECFPVVIVLAAMGVMRGTGPVEASLP